MSDPVVATPEEASATVPSILPMPSWTDAASVTTFLTSAAGVVLAVVELVDPTGGAKVASTTQVVLPTLGFAIAAVAQVINVIMHRTVQKAAITAGMMRR